MPVCLSFIYTLMLLLLSQDIGDILIHWQRRPRLGIIVYVELVTNFYEPYSPIHLLRPKLPLKPCS